jgi:hypothetical protein
LSLIAGICLLLAGVFKLVTAGEWVLVLLAALIIAFTLSSMSKNKPES